MNTLYPTQLEMIEEIICRSRYGEELFFTDCRKAAKDILQYLHNEEMLKAKVVPLVIDDLNCMVI